MKIAVLGLGRMGHAVAERLQAGGHDLTVWNRSQGKADDLVQAGANEARAPQEAAASAEVVVTSLTSDDAVRRLALDDGELRSALLERPYADTSTISPGLSAELGRSFEHFVAAPILGAPEAVRSGDAIYLAGGPAATLDRLAPMFESLSERVRRFSRPELASSGKLAVNLLLVSGIATLAEAVTVGRAGGLGDEELADLLSETPMLAPGLKNRLEGVLQGSGAAWWTTVLAGKDAGLATDLVGSAGGHLRISPLLRDLYRSAADAGFADDDMVAVARLYR